jgi:hypothetical protein
MSNGRSRKTEEEERADRLSITYEQALSVLYAHAHFAISSCPIITLKLLAHTTASFHVAANIAFRSLEVPTAF